LLRAMKGDISVRNHPEGGAEFVLTVPIATHRP
jgi:signal transduction histidine kinase